MANQIEGIQGTQSQSSQSAQSTQVSQVVAFQEQYSRHMAEAAEYMAIAISKGLKPWRSALARR